ncbi:hypothetical protein I3760_07G183000 [Carya illinoinensis]|nr:hypothetical protein I3760_07G183000 [Carya illinoinensis]
MPKPRLLALLYLITAFVMHCNCQERKVHVVYMGEKPRGGIFGASTPHVMHCSMLEKVLGSTTAAKDSLIYSYGKSFNGFAAKLTDEEVARFAEIEEVVSVFPNTMFELHTTRSWDFLGFTRSHVRRSRGGKDVIVGIIDSGIWPESDSFNDKGFGPPPAKWKGTCQTNENFTCNNKIIGARYYNSRGVYSPEDIQSPRDSRGHGTHTAAIAAGIKVSRASYYGLAMGNARGGAPNARLSVYKVCWSGVGCYAADILAAFDDAIADGVDILSISIGAPYAFPYWEDPVAIGSFHAMMRGILTSASAGNNGPDRAVVQNYSPWLLTVAASSIDRRFVSQLVLGNGQIYTGSAINSFDLNGTLFPLTWAGDATNYSANSISEISSHCYPGTLDSKKVEGKIVLCEGRSDGSAIIMANGVGVIMPSRPMDNLAAPFPLPSTLISTENISEVLDYITSSNNNDDDDDHLHSNPEATILVSEEVEDTVAPSAASFSSRGPNPIAPDILKPDLSAPGVNILAAWSPIGPASVYDQDTRSTKYFIDSGTSISCPHASGAAAHVKAAHPSWSPAAIKSALMTTAYMMDPDRHENEEEFAYGSGLLNPAKAVDPGLVFNASASDYIGFLCHQGYNTTTLRLVTGDRSVCESTKPGRGWHLNYPSFSLAIEDGHKIRGTFRRTVTNVGSPDSTYYASIDIPDPLIHIHVKPSVLSFSAVGEEKSFTVTVRGPYLSQMPIISGSIVWSDGVHGVRTPLVIYTVLHQHLPTVPHD